MNKGLAIAVIVIILGVVAGSYAYETYGASGSSVTFKAADAPMANISAVYITFSSVEVHANSSGWTNYSLGDKTINILGTTATNATILGKFALKSQVYTEFRIYISKVVVDIAGVNTTMHMALGYGFLNHAVDLSAHSTGSIIFEFNLNSDMNMISDMFTPSIGVVYQTQ